jgi:hypothetical protein
MESSDLRDLNDNRQMILNYQNFHRVAFAMDPFAGNWNTLTRFRIPRSAYRATVSVGVNRIKSWEAINGVELDHFLDNSSFLREDLPNRQNPSNIAEYGNFDVPIKMERSPQGRDTVTATATAAAAAAATATATVTVTDTGMSEFKFHKVLGFRFSRARFSPLTLVPGRLCLTGQRSNHGILIRPHFLAILSTLKESGKEFMEEFPHQIQGLITVSGGRLKEVLNGMQKLYNIDHGLIALIRNDMIVIWKTGEKTCNLFLIRKGTAYALDSTRDIESGDYIITVPLSITLSMIQSQCNSLAFIWNLRYNAFEWRAEEAVIILKVE